MRLPHRRRRGEGRSGTAETDRQRTHDAGAKRAPIATNSISLDPDAKDAWGLPAIRVTHAGHPNDCKLVSYMDDRGVELMQAAGARRTWRFDIPKETIGGQPHLLGTCRMGNDPRHSVVNRSHRRHDVAHLFIVDGSSLVTSGRGQPTLTFQALPLRAGEHIARLAKAGEIWVVRRAAEGTC